MVTLANMFTPLRRATRGRRVGPIGLDIGTREVKAVQLARETSGAWVLHASAVYPRRGGSKVDGDEARRAGDVLFRRGFMGNELVLAVPDEKLLTANLELPPRSQELPLDQIARAEFARSLKVESDPFEFSYWDLPAPARAARTTHVMGVGCRHADSEPAIDAFEAAGFELRAIEVEPCALTRACFPVCAPPSEITALVDIGWHAVKLFVVHQGVVSYKRSLPGFGFSRLHQALADQLEIQGDDVIEHVLRRASLSSADADEAATNQEVRSLLQSHFDAVAAEITTSLSYSSHQYPDAPVKRVLLCGGGASLAGLDAYFSQRLAVETMSVRAGSIVKIGDDVRRNETNLSLAIGLAQRDADGYQA